MFDSYSIRLIKSTISDLKNHNEDFIERFYSLLFTNYPEILFRFKQVEQKNLNLPNVLIDVIIYYEEYEGESTYLNEIVHGIALKHVSIGIQPEHYDGLGHCFLEAMQSVLEEKATMKVMYAWTKAYWKLADILMKKEAMIYLELAKRNVE